MHEKKFLFLTLFLSSWRCGQTWSSCLTLNYCPKLPARAKTGLDGGVGAAVALAGVAATGKGVAAGAVALAVGAEALAVALSGATAVAASSHSYTRTTAEAAATLLREAGWWAQRR
jgi:hypothetical protein